MPAASQPFHIRKPLFLPLAVWFTAWLLIRLVTDFDGLFGQDPYEYARYAASLYGGPPDPDFFWTPGYPLAGGAVGWLIGNFALGLQIVSMLSVMGCVIYVVRWLNDYLPGRKSELAWFAMLIVGLSPYLFRHGMQVMSDGPAALCVIGAMAHADRFRREGGWQEALFSGLWIGVGLWVRIGAGPVLVVPGLMLLLATGSRKEWSGMIGAVMALLLAFLMFRIKGMNAAGTGDHPLLETWSVGNFFHSDFQTPDGYLHFRFPNLLFNLQILVHPASIPIAAPVIAGWLIFRPRTPKIIWAALIGLAVNQLFISGITNQNERFWVVVIPLLAVLVIPLFLSLYDELPVRKAAMVYPLLFIPFFLLSVRALLPSMKYQISEKAIMGALSDVPPGAVYQLGWDGPVRFRLHPPRDSYTIIHDPEKQPEAGDYLIWNLDYPEQWVDRKPMEFYLHNSVRFDMREIAKFEKWSLLRFEKKGINPVEN